MNPDNSARWYSVCVGGVVPCVRDAHPHGNAGVVDVSVLHAIAKLQLLSRVLLINAFIFIFIFTRSPRYSPGHGEATDDWQGTVNQYSRRWTGRRTRRADNNYPIGAAGRWAASDYTALSTRVITGARQTLSLSQFVA